MTHRMSFAPSVWVLVAVLVGSMAACTPEPKALAQRQCDTLLGWVAAAETPLSLRVGGGSLEEVRQAQLDAWDASLVVQAEDLPTDLASAFGLAFDDRPLLNGNGVPTPELADAVRVVGRYVVGDCGGSARVFSFIYPYWEPLDT